jgi:hypothetical protein
MGADSGMLAGATPGGGPQNTAGTAGQGNAAAGGSAIDDQADDDGCSMALGARRHDFGAAQGALVLVCLTALRRRTGARRRRAGAASPS